MQAAVVALVIAAAVGLTEDEPPRNVDIKSYAFVNENGTLTIRGKTIKLYGIHIPRTDRTCRTFERPVKCGPRAALALDFNIGNHFVGCIRKGDAEGVDMVGRCWAGGRDLSAQLLEQGWAAALPDAPYEYVVLEKIARQRGVGIWGIPVDRIIESPPR